MSCLYNIQSGTQPTWIGLDCDSPNYWSDGYPTTYKNFKSNCKSNQGATINSNDNGQWDDHPKTELHNVICKIPGSRFFTKLNLPFSYFFLSSFLERLETKVLSESFVLALATHRLNDISITISLCKQLIYFMRLK